MKQFFLIATIISLLTVVLYGIKKGVFRSDADGMVDIRMPEVVDYNFHIKPILSDNCYTCHGPDANKRKAGLRLDLQEVAFAELPETPGQYAIVAGKPHKSAIFERITSDDPATVMPPPDSKRSLKPYEKELIKKWISQGGKFQKHWAFQVPKKSELPLVTDTAWAQNEIDLFVLHKLEEHNLTPSRRASKEALARRLSLDLTGLPPGPLQLQKWGADLGAVPLDSIIEDLLAAPAYGERMTQSWLDVARYADSHGYQDDSYRTMWPWRDWVIHAFNENLPYDEFLTWQLAGDLLPDATKEQVLATGFNRNHPITQEGGVIQEEYRTTYVTDRTNTLGKGILGITLECARCHDHKYDAISQKEYYQMFSFFNQVDEKGLQMDAVQAANQKFYADPPYMTITEAETRSVLSFVNLEKGKELNVMVMNDSAPRPTFLLNRGNYDEPADTVRAGTPSKIFPFAEDLPRNRLGLAQWVTSKENPLTARVFVNKVWGMLFGRGLVETAEDFGVQGSLPTHPELLDWLAADFMEHGWDIKYLLTKIVHSATYQQRSELSPALNKADPENIYLARAPRFRMSGEMIRDYVLATSGLLNREIGGPSVKPYQPPGLWEETNAGGNRGILTTYVPDVGDKLYRRSLYTFWKRTLPPASMTIFDAPTRDFCEVRRQKTNTPLQALALQNDVQMLEAARVLAQSTVAAIPDTASGVGEIFRRILVRQPGGDELRVLEEYYMDTQDHFRKDTEAAEKLLAVGDFKGADTDPSKTAALMLTAQVIYNLDETITKE